MDKVLDLYPSDVTKGSPYDTGTQNALTPEFKRMASFLGDFKFQEERRFLLQYVSEKQKAWSYCTLHLSVLICAGHPLPNSRQFLHSKQTRQVAAYLGFAALFGSSIHLRWARSGGLPNQLRHKLRSQWPLAPALATV
jgi:hypothetical protein